MIDTHTHLNFGAFDKDVGEVIERAEKIGVRKFIVPGARLDSSEKALELSQQFGLDFKRDLPLQIECLKKQLELAVKYNKP